MVSKKQPVEQAWIASRLYQFRRAEGEWQELFVGLGMPHKLRKSERPIDSDVPQYGCLIQVGAEFTRHTVSGRDALEALCHGVLAIEAFLVKFSKDHEVVDVGGTKFELQRDGLFFGPIGAEYLQHLR